MKRYLFVLVMVGLLGLSYCSALAGLSVVSVDGQIGTDTIMYGAPITINILWDGSDSPGDYITGCQNGYRVWSPSGVNVEINDDTLNDGTLANTKWNPAIDWDALGFDGGVFAEVRTDSDPTQDSAGFGGFRLFGTGVPDTFYGIAHIIHLEPFPLSSVGGEICIDSASFGCCPWLWSTTGGHFSPSWSGPHCYTIANCCVGIRGDANLDRSLDVADFTFLVDYLFRQGPASLCHDEADVNASGGVYITDLTYLCDYLFRGGSAPSACPEE